MGQEYEHLLEVVCSQNGSGRPELKENFLDFAEIVSIIPYLVKEVPTAPNQPLYCLTVCRA